MMNLSLNGWVDALSKDGICELCMINGFSSTYKTNRRNIV